MLSCSAQAQTYPAKPVNFIVTFPAGSGPDIIGRLAGQWLSERLGQQFVIENKPGFGGNVATEYVVNSSADGYTILMPVSTNAVNATLYPNLSFNFMRDIAPIAGIGKTPFVVVVPPSFPAKTLPSSSPMPKPIQARSIWLRAASGARRMSAANCSRS